MLNLHTIPESIPVMLHISELTPWDNASCPARRYTNVFNVKNGRIDEDEDDGISRKNGTRRENTKAYGPDASCRDILLDLQYANTPM
jgi:hypothetical protein